jgi:hypothetical protein
LEAFVAANNRKTMSDVRQVQRYGSGSRRGRLLRIVKRAEQVTMTSNRILGARVFRYGFGTSLSLIMLVLLLLLTPIRRSLIDYFGDSGRVSIGGSVANSVYLPDVAIIPIAAFCILNIPAIVVAEVVMWLALRFGLPSGAVRAATVLVVSLLLSFCQWFVIAYLRINRHSGFPRIDP